VEQSLVDIFYVSLITHAQGLGNRDVLTRSYKQDSQQTLHTANFSCISFVVGVHKDSLSGHKRDTTTQARRSLGGDSSSEHSDWDLSTSFLVLHIALSKGSLHSVLLKGNLLPGIRTFLAS